MKRVLFPGRLALVLTAGLLFAGTAHAQTWVLAYDVGQQDKVYGVQATDDCGYVVAGRTLPTLGGNADLFVMRIDSRGTPRWQRRFDTGGTQDHAWDVAATPDGGYVVAGTTDSVPGHDVDAWVLKLGADGNVEWHRAYGGPAEENVYSVEPTSDGGYVLAGRTDSFGAGLLDAWVVKLDAAGAVEWQRSYGGTNHDFAYDIRQTPDGGYVFTGYFASQGSFEYDIWVARLDAAGDLLWMKDFGDTHGGFSIEPLAGAGYAVAGTRSKFENGTQEDDIVLLRLDGSGNLLWSRVWGDAGGTQTDDGVSAVRATPDGGFVLSGFTVRTNGLNYDSLVLKVDAQGDLQWERQYGGAADEQTFQSALLSDGGVALAGHVPSFPGESDFMLMKLGADGLLGPCSRAAGLSEMPSSVAERSASAVVTATAATVSLPALTVTETAASAQVRCQGLPSEVSHPRSAQPLIFRDPVTLEWEDPLGSGSQLFNVYRGDLADLPLGDYGSCLHADLIASTATDPDQPAAGAGWFYLVAGANASGEGPLGCDCCGGFRESGSACP